MFTKVIEVRVLKLTEKEKGSDAFFLMPGKSPADPGMKIGGSRNVKKRIYSDPFI